MEIKEREHLDKIEDIKGDQKEIGWGSQIRSYVFHPYNMVKDHRTNFEVGNIGAVMDGDLDGFINAYLKAANTGSLNLDNPYRLTQRSADKIKNKGLSCRTPTSRSSSNP